MRIGRYAVRRVHVRRPTSRQATNSVVRKFLADTIDPRMCQPNWCEPNVLIRGTG